MWKRQLGRAGVPDTETACLDGRPELSPQPHPDTDRLVPGQKFAVWTRGEWLCTACPEDEHKLAGLRLLLIA